MRIFGLFSFSWLYLLTSWSLGLNLWSAEIIEEHKNTVHHPQQKVEWTSGQTQNDKYDYLKLDLYGSVTVDLKMGEFLDFCHNWL